MWCDQDLLDYVTYAGGVGRRRADAVSGLGASLRDWGDGRRSKPMLGAPELDAKRLHNPLFHIVSIEICRNQKGHGVASAAFECAALGCPCHSFPGTTLSACGCRNIQMMSQTEKQEQYILQLHSVKR